MTFCVTKQVLDRTYYQTKGNKREGAARWR